MPSTKNQEKYAAIKEDLSKIQAMWVVDYRGLTVKESEALRRSIREADAVMKVYKNSLVELALKELDMPSMGDVLAGPSAFVFADGDPVASAKALKDFAKANENLVIKGGIMDGAFVDAEAVEKIAALPSRENSSPSSLVRFKILFSRLFAFSMVQWSPLHASSVLSRIKRMPLSSGITLEQSSYCADIAA